MAAKQNRPGWRTEAASENNFAAEAHTTRVLPPGGQVSTPTMFSGQRATRNAIADIDLETMARRLLAEAFTSALPGQWETRARVFESCRPRQGDYLGEADRAQVAAQDRHCAELAAGCRLHAALLRGDDLASPALAVCWTRMANRQRHERAEAIHGRLWGLLRRLPSLDDRELALVSAALDLAKGC